MSLTKFNQKYKTEFSEKTTELDALSKNIGDEGLKILCSVKFVKLTQLLLEENDIHNINCIEKNHFGKDLIALDLSTNKITDINPLAKVTFPNLHHLFLNSNLIASLDVFAKVNFPELKELNLSNNKIESLQVFKSVKFLQLKQLDLSKNQINDISPLAEANFKELEELFLDQNQIDSIDILLKMNCQNLKKLKLEKNNVNNIDILEKIPFTKLNYLSLGDDTLGEKVEVLKKIKFSELEDIYLYLNDTIDREQDKIQGIVNYFEEKGITFNFISCDDDNDVDNFGGDADNLGGFKDLLDNDNDD